MQSHCSSWRWSCSQRKSYTPYTYTTPTHTHMNTPTCTHIHVRTHGRTHTCTHTHMHTHTHKHIHTHMHTRTHTHMYTHMHKLTHIHDTHPPTHTQGIITDDSDRFLFGGHVEMLTKPLSHYVVYYVFILLRCCYKNNCELCFLLHEYICECIIECLSTVVGVVSVMEISWERYWNHSQI